MKKEYIKPVANIYKVTTHSFIAASIDTGGESEQGEYGDTKKSDMWGWEDDENEGK